MNPRLYEINTRGWRRELSEAAGKAVTWANIPDSEFLHWRETGFTHVWLMGVWHTGLRSRAQSLAQSEIRIGGQQLLPNFPIRILLVRPMSSRIIKCRPRRVAKPGSRFFREKLQVHGTKLILDFVANHVGLDHRWVLERPELLVQSLTETTGVFHK